MLVTVEHNRGVAVVDVVAGVVERLLRTEQEGTHMVALSADRRTAYTGNIGSATISVLDLSDGAVRTIPVGPQPEAIAVTPHGQVWVGSNSGDEVHVVDPASGETLARLPAIRFPIRVEATPDGSRVLVTNVVGNALQVFDARTREQLGVVSLDVDDGQTAAGQRTAAPIGTLPAPDGRHVFVALNATGQVAVVDLERLEVVRYLDVGPGPDGLGFAAR